MASSRYVELDLTVRVEVEDEAALRAAAEAAGLDDSSELASCVGFLAQARRAVDGIPGIRKAGTAASAGYYEPGSLDRE